MPRNRYSWAGSASSAVKADDSERDCKYPPSGSPAAAGRVHGDVGADPGEQVVAGQQDARPTRRAGTSARGCGRVSRRHARRARAPRPGRRGRSGGPVRAWRAGRRSARPAAPSRPARPGARRGRAARRGRYRPGRRSTPARAGSRPRRGACRSRAPPIERSQPLAPWWSGWTWVTTMPVTSAGRAPAMASPAVSAARPSGESHPGSTTTTDEPVNAVAQGVALRVVRHRDRHRPHPGPHLLHRRQHPLPPGVALRGPGDLDGVQRPRRDCAPVTRGDAAGRQGDLQDQLDSSRCHRCRRPRRRRRRRCRPGRRPRRSAG